MIGTECRWWQSSRFLSTPQESSGPVVDSNLTVLVYQVCRMSEGTTMEDKRPRQTGPEFSSWRPERDTSKSESCAQRITMCQMM
jgi:hypothetical protein